jgi:enamine deaminase RidA (YjgF/YER057c/UK114 family)
MSIERLHSGARMSQVVIHGGTVYLSGQVSHDNRGSDVAQQAREVLASIDRLLEEAKTDKSKILSATIWLTDMRTFAAFNEVWDAWVDSDHPPARACVEARLAAPGVDVEIGIIAARAD